ncbi:hypothetical protein B0T16DRAFT_372167 [Cercophora newfieldiana]|uniref:Uncharacterized protein n=1 Tax=Cercophora newfieldiana TaxID=92897 RepID=A0AA39YCB7_9PEZI|nr:hypothetical protein B0T16DRAFT_372167 [Cercophora newfieldiana]
MVFSQITQPDSSYLTWTRFAFPDAERGPVPAFSVSIQWSRYIQSGYTMMSTLIVVNITAIFIAGGLWIYLRGSRAGNQVNDISISLWNKREATHMSVIDTLFYSRDALKKWWYYPLVAALLGAWAASVLAGIFMPPRVFLGNAAPVNPSSIFVPPDMNKFQNTIPYDVLYRTYAMNVDTYLRAAGAAYIAAKDVRDRVRVNPPVSLGTWTGPDPLDPKKQRVEQIQRMDYGYNITGAEMGLQRLPKLQLRVVGSCVTNYSWFQHTTKNDKLLFDNYQSQWLKPGNLDSISASCPSPSARFKVDPNPQQLEGNSSWAVIISSVDRLSYTASDDPWYRTKPFEKSEQSRMNITSVKYGNYIVNPGRPVLSCWQRDLWFWGDEGSQKNSSLVNLQAMVGKNLLSDAMVEVLQRYFTTPVAYNLGFALQGSALQASKTTVGKVFSAGASSIYRDLCHIILSAYIATENTLTDTTLYASQSVTGDVPPKFDLPNLALNNSTQNPRPGVEEFVVFTNKAVALELTTTILIPILTLGSWLLMHMMLGLTPLKMAAAMESIELFKAVKSHYGEPAVHLAEDGVPKWTL